jgi:hypothetical protein
VTRKHSCRHRQDKRPPPLLQALLEEGTLAGAWVLGPRKSSIRLKSRSFWGLAPVRGVFREFSGSGTVTADGEVSGTLRHIT